MDIPLLRVIPPLDRFALVLFCLSWLGYGPAFRMIRRRSINAGLHGVRVLWMRSAILRDNRIADSSLIGHVVHSASFLASTNLIAIGALLGVLTGIERLQPAIEGLSLGAVASREFLEVKLLLPLAVLVHALFKTTWSLRQMNYTVALMGAIPPAPVPAELRDPLALEIGGVLTSAVTAYNAGIRSYYFALVGLCWLAGPWALMGMTLVLVGVLLHRQFGSAVSGQMERAWMLVDQAHRMRKP